MSDIDRQARTRLPAAVYELAMRLGVSPNSERSGAKLTQRGQMKRDLEAEVWMKFSASQTISMRACEFDWRAKAGPFGLISARDALLNGEGRLDITALGFIPIASAEHTTALMRGELMRYLAEIPWAPDAILSNPSLRWREEGPDGLAVGAGAGDTACEVVLHLDSDGRIASTFAPDRPRAASGSPLPTPWEGQFSDYRRCGDTWIPFVGEVAWEIDGRQMPYWKGHIERWAAA